MNSRLSFRLLWISQAIANFADILYVLAIVLALYHWTDSAFAASLVPLCRVGAQFAGGFVAPVMMDRWPLAKLLSRAQHGQTLLFIGLAGFLAVGLNAWTWPLAYAWIATISFFDGWTNPAKRALVPRLVAKSDWARANGWLSTVDQTVGLAGWAAGGMIVALIGEGRTLGMTAVLFVIVSMMTPFIREPATEANGGPRESDSRGRSIRQGWHTIRRHRAVRRLLGIDLIEGIVGSIWIGSILLAYVEDALREGERWWGILNSSYFLGAIAGGILVTALLPRMQHRLKEAMLAGAFAMSVLTFLFALTGIPWAAAALTILMGPAYQFRDVAQQTLLQHAVPEHEFPKLQAAYQSVLLVVFGLSVLLMGAVTDWFGVRATYTLGGAFFLLSATYSYYIKRVLGPETEQGGKRI